MRLLIFLFVTFQVLLLDADPGMKGFVPKVLQSSEDGYRYVIWIRIEDTEEQIEIFRSKQYQPQTKVAVGNSEVLLFQVPNCYYDGKIIGQPDSKVYVKYNKTLDGHIYYNEKVYTIRPEDPESDLESSLHFVVFKEESDEPEYHCGNSHNHSKFKDNHRYSRSDSDQQVEGLFYAKISVVYPYSMYSDPLFGRNSTIFSTIKILDMFHQTRFHYSFVDIIPICMYIQLWTDEVNFPTVREGINPHYLLDLVQYERYNKLYYKGEHHDQTTMFINFIIQGIVGLAYVGTICSRQYSVAWSVFGDQSRLYSGVFSHELGHNLGADHDTSSCVCPGFMFCIMSSSTSLSINYKDEGFSNCSKIVFEREKSFPSTCIRNPPDLTKLDVVCGDGIVNGDEDCDCGSEEECYLTGQSQTCDYKTCKHLKPKYCMGGPCCGPDQKITFGNTCRHGDGFCMEDSVCDGISSQCPTGDVVKASGTSCDDGKGTCHQGECRTREGECHYLWGPASMLGLESCNELNMDGRYYGNCGIDLRNRKGYAFCDFQDVGCGKIYCNMTFIPPALDYKAWTVDRKCNVADSLDGDLTEIGLVRDFVPCKHNSRSTGGTVCYNHKCVKIEDAINLESKQNIGKNVISIIEEICVEPYYVDKHGNCVQKDSTNTTLVTVVVVSTIVGICALLTTGLVLLKKNKFQKFSNI